MIRWVLRKLLGVPRPQLASPRERAVARWDRLARENAEAADILRSSGASPAAARVFVVASVEARRVVDALQSDCAADIESASYIVRRSR